MLRGVGRRRRDLIGALAAAISLFFPCNTAVAAEPDMRAAMLEPSDLPGYLLDLERPVHDAFIENPYPFLTEVRRQTVVDNWQRLLVRPDYLRTVSVQLIQFRNREMAEALTGTHGSRDPTPPPLPSGAVATIGENERHYAERAAVFYVGPVFVRIETIAFGRGAGRHGERLLSRAAALQADRIGARPQTQADSISTSGLKRRLSVAMFSSLVWVILLATSLTWLLDPSARRRLRLRFSGRPDPPANAIDVNGEAARLIRRHAVEALIRIVLLLAFVACALLLNVGTLEAALLLTAGIAAWSWVEGRGWLPGRSVTYRNPRLFEGWALVGAFVALLFTVALIYSGAFFVWIGTLTELFGLPDVETEDVEKMRLLQAFFGVALIFASVVPLQLARRLAMRRAHRRLERDDRSPVLFLRAFADDRIKLRTRRTRRTSIFDRIALRRRDRLEEILAAQLNAYGPVEAIGEPGVRLPPLGAARRSYMGEDWRAAVQASIDRAALIAVELGRTESLAWEIGQIRDRGALGKTFFVLPPVASHERRARLHALAEVLDLPPQYLDRERPGLEVLAVLAPDPAQPRLIVSGARDDVSYELAVESGVESLHGFETGLRWQQPAPEPAAPEPLQLAGPLWHPPGGAPRPRRWYRHRWVWLALIWIAIPGLLSLLRSSSPEQTDFDAAIPLPHSPRLVMATPSPERVIAVEERDGPGVAVTEVDLASERRRPLGTSPSLLTEGALGEGWAVFTAPRDDAVTGIRLDGRGRWEVELGTTPRGVVIDGSAAFVALTGSDEIAKLRLADGKLLRRAPLGPAPWGVSQRGDSLLVTLAGNGAVAAVDPDELAPRTRLATVSAPRTIDASGPGTWVMSASEGRLELLGHSGAVAARSENPLFAFAASDRYAAMTTGDGTGLSVFHRRTGTSVREMLFSVPIRATAITTAGDVVVAFVGVPGLGVVRVSGTT
jgi:hypothetical protein